LDYFLQQVMSCFGGKYEGFWNAEAIIQFFSDNQVAEKIVTNVSKTVEDKDEMGWTEWDSKTKKADECKSFLERKRYTTTAGVGGSKIATAHYDKMFAEFSETVTILHEHLQKHPNHPETLSRWSRLEPLIVFKDTFINDITLDHTRLQVKEEEPQIERRPSTAQTSDRVLVQEKQLDMISESVGRLKELGLCMEKEVKEQNQIAAEVAKLVDIEQGRTSAATTRAQRL
jgi:hemoglobin-like flavoprotein